ncbi:MAG: lysophospholipid acyltransferase family protein [Desulfarculaceae bacterium]|nr:lysophospholipid acyltransferase family protein [Desulfarculaceae bacterium]
MTEDRIYRLIRLAFMLIGKLPASAAEYAAGAIGRLWFRLDKRHRRVVLENLSFSFPQMGETERILLAKRVFKNIAAMIFEIGWLYRLPRKLFEKFFDIKGIENLEQALEKNKGAIVLTCHMGNWELLVTVAAMTGYRTNAVYRKLDFAPADRFILEARQRFGTRMIPLRGASRKLDSILENGELVGTLLDQNVDWYKGVFVDFFGRPACTNNGLAALALRTRSPVVPLYIVKENGKYKIEFLPEIPLTVTGDRIKDIENNTRHFTKAIESIIRQYPDQWFWVHNRWKTKNYCLL